MPTSHRWPTARKIAVARVLSKLVRGARRIAGRREHEVICRRRGARWSLDLREGVQLALYLGLYERTTAKRLQQLARTGHTVIDVGANVGAHTVPLARAVGRDGRVIAVEPTTAAFVRLQRNIALNPDLAARITPVHAALGAPGGSLQAGYFSAWPLGDGREAGLHPVHRGAVHASGAAAFYTLDDLLGSMGVSRVHALKIDVDGAEMDVLEGARGVICRDRPAVVFEVCPYLLGQPGRTASDLLRFFTSRDYELLDERNLSPLPADLTRVLASIPARGGRNVIARPR